MSPPSLRVRNASISAAPTLADNLLEASVPAAAGALVAAIRDPLVREMAADLACARGFRRDIYHRGAGRLPARRGARTA